MKNIEKAIIKAMLVDEEAALYFYETLDLDDFEDRRLNTIFAIVMQLCYEKTPVNPATVSQCLENHGLLEDIGGEAFIMDLVSRTYPSERTIPFELPG